MNSTQARQIVVGAENGRRKSDRDLESERYPTIVFTPERIEGDDMHGDIIFTVPYLPWELTDPSTFPAGGKGDRGESGFTGYSPVTGRFGL